MLKDLGHAYVELHVRFWRDVVGLDKRKQVPRWYARLWQYPDSTWSHDPLRWKTLGYHVGHVTAWLVPILALIVIIA